MRVAVIGGGISGLAAAHRLYELDPTLRVEILETRPRLGGVLHTERDDQYLIEHSADMFSRAEPWALRLAERVGLQNELIETDPRFRRALVVKRGRLHPVPDGFALLQPRKAWPILTSGLLSTASKARLAAEAFVPRARTSADESLESFAVRRFGRGAFRWLIQPLVGGIYTADPACLSMAATLERFRRMEATHGSLIRASFAKTAKKNAAEDSASGARYGLFAAPQLGMTQFVEAIAARLPAGTVHVGERVTSLIRMDQLRWQITCTKGQLSRVEEFNAVILAIPSHAAARLLESSSLDLARNLRAISHAGAAIAVLGYDRSQIRHRLNAFGFVMPLAEKRDILSASFASVKFPGRAAPNRVLIRVFMGGACQPDLLDRNDQELIATAVREVGELLGISGGPHLSRLVRWHETMPQYHVGHLDRVTEIERLSAQIPALALAGNSYRGVGIPFCVRSGELAAEHIHNFLSHRGAATVLS